MTGDLLVPVIVVVTVLSVPVAGRRTIEVGEFTVLLGSLTIPVDGRRVTVPEFVTVLVGSVVTVPGVVVLIGELEPPCELGPPVTILVGSLTIPPGGRCTTV